MKILKSGTSMQDSYKPVIPKKKMTYDKRDDTNK